MIYIELQKTNTQVIKYKSLLIPCKVLKMQSINFINISIHHMKKKSTGVKKFFVLGDTFVYYFLILLF